MSLVNQDKEPDDCRGKFANSPGTLCQLSVWTARGNMGQKSGGETPSSTLSWGSIGPSTMCLGGTLVHSHPRQRAHRAKRAVCSAKCPQAHALFPSHPALKQLQHVICAPSSLLFIHWHKNPSNTHFAEDFTGEREGICNTQKRPPVIIIHVSIVFLSLPVFYYPSSTPP